MLRQHVRSGYQTVDHERAHEDRHAGGARHAERNGRHKSAAFTRIVRALGSDNAAHVATAKALGRALFSAHRMTVGEPVDHRAANAGNRAKRSAKPRATQNQPPMIKAILGALIHAATIGARHVAGDGCARNRKVGELGQSKQTKHDRDQRGTFPEVERVERPAQRARLRVGADHRYHQAKTGDRKTAQRGVSGKHGHHRDAEHREGQQFRAANVQHDRTQDRQRNAHQDCAENTAHHRRHVGSGESATGFAALCHRQAVENRSRRPCAAWHTKENGGNRIASRRR